MFSLSLTKTSFLNMDERTVDTSSVEILEDNKGSIGKNDADDEKVKVILSHLYFY